EVDTWIGGGGVAAAAEDVGTLAYAGRGEEDFGANGVAGAFRAADEFQREPVITVADDIAEECGGRIDVVEDDVNVAVVEDVAEGGATGGDDVSESRGRGGGDLLEFFAVEIAEKQRALRPSGAPVGFVSDGVDVAVGDEEVEKAIVVEIEEAAAPA